jgi:methylmalonyl-CoA mutase
VPALARALQEAGAGDVLVVVGGVIPAADYEFLKNAGAAAVFGPGTVIAEAAREVLQAVRERRGIVAAAG